jgi:DNA-binding winged helix-turn-helix (wHTH) protein/TolB-like protein/Tfp pilus assembly protein PilF
MGEPDNRFYEFGPFSIDAKRRVLLRDGRDVPLSPKAFDTLLVLVRHHGEVLEKGELMEKLWPDSEVEEANLPLHISALRKALGESPNERKYIVTVPGKGYKFAAEVNSTDDVSEMILARYAKSTLVIEDEEQAAMLEQAPESLPPAGASSKRGLLIILLAGIGVAGLGLAGYFLLRSSPSTLSTAPAISSSASTTPIKTLAVLPFKPLVADQRDESLEMGMADTLIVRLSNLSELTVRPLGSVRRYGGLEQDPLAAGRQLGVEAVIDGTIQRSGDRIRVTARLIAVGDGRQLWEGRYDTPSADIFSVQDAISEKLVAALKPRLTSAEEGRLAKHYTENVEAYQLYLRGRHHALKRILPETQKAISYFQQAIDLDPSYALAYAGLADAHISSLATDLPPNEFLPQARAAAQMAIEIDDTLAEAHAELGFVIFWWDWDWDASEKEFKRALELDPNNANAHLFYAHLLSNTGRHSEALAEAKRARELDPLNLRNNALEGQFLIHAGRTDEALARLREILEIEPNYFLAHQYASSAYIEKGMYLEAISEARRAREISGAKSTYLEAFLGYALAKFGKVAEARSLLESLLKSSVERYIDPYTIALVYNGLGEHDEAFAWLERAYAQHSKGMVFLNVEPKWNNLRSAPRFQDLLRRLGLSR